MRVKGFVAGEHELREILCKPHIVSPHKDFHQFDVEGGG